MTQLSLFNDWENDLIGTMMFTDCQTKPWQTIKAVETHAVDGDERHLVVKYEETKWQQGFSNREHLENWTKVHQSIADGTYVSSN